MKVLKSLFLVLAFVSQITVYASYAPVPVVKDVVAPKVKTIEQIIDEKAIQYGVSAERVHYIVKRESQYNPSAIGDMDITCKRTGLPVRARGILQITECFYPDVSDKCAFDVVCSLDRMLPVMRDDENCLSQWSTCSEELVSKTAI